MTKRAKQIIGGVVGLLLLLGLALLLQLAVDDEDACIVYQKQDFDRHKGNFRPLDHTQLDQSDDSCGGKALRLRRTQPGGDFGAEIPIFIEGAERLKVVFLCKAKGVPKAMLNLWNKTTQDNITPKTYRPLSADSWTPVIYHVDDFRNNAGDLQSTVKPGAFLQSLAFFGEQPDSSDTWMLIDNFAIYRGNDRTPPERVKHVQTATTVKCVRLSWRPAEDNVGVMLYVVERGEGGEGAFHKIVETPTPFFEDFTPPTGQLRYRVQAQDFEENRGEWSEPIQVNSSPPH